MSFTDHSALIANKSNVWNSVASTGLGRAPVNALGHHDRESRVFNLEVGTKRQGFLFVKCYSLPSFLPNEIFLHNGLRTTETARLIETVSISTWRCVDLVSA